MCSVHNLGEMIMIFDLNRWKLERCYYLYMNVWCVFASDSSDVHSELSYTIMVELDRNEWCKSTPYMLSVLVKIHSQFNGHSSLPFFFSFFPSFSWLTFVFFYSCSLNSEWHIVSTSFPCGHHPIPLSCHFHWWRKNQALFVHSLAASQSCSRFLRIPIVVQQKKLNPDCSKNDDVNKRTKQQQQQ